ncbi:MAG TPA: hypothetical protein VHJ77_19855 [Vicinamibacterales bacterium]|jgi:hypothetical protein|nr:hypothetical protein [Vicinamibacterales bacterium]
MDDTLANFWTNLVGRLTGPMTFRLILQPVMATIYAIRDGMKDAREGRPPYFWSIFTHPGEAGPLLREGARAVGRVILLGIVMDLVYQLIVFRSVHPIELVVVVFLLAFNPYLVLRGPVNRIAAHWVQHPKVPTR